MKRCDWVPEGDPDYVAYHDEEWGVSSRDDRHLFEMLTLEGAQAGLSWSTILRKRDGYRKAFANFDARRVARFTQADVERLLQEAAVRGPEGRQLENEILKCHAGVGWLARLRLRPASM